MQINMQIKKIGIPLCITVIFAAVFMLIYTPTYAINDDLMIEGILSGSYFKVYPYTYYFRAPLGLLISALYSISIGNIPWFGLFIIGANICSIYAIEYVAVNRVCEGIKKLIPIFISIIMILCLQFQGFVLPHYTVVAASLGAAGLLLFITARNEKQFVAPIFFFIMTYLVRENVFFMLVPFIGIAFIYLLVVNKNYSLKKYFLYAISFIVIAGAMILLNHLMGNSAKWNNYKQFNKIRTDVYDYTGVPDDDEALAYYLSKDIDESDIDLIKSYNITLASQETIKDELEVIAKYAYGRKNETGFKTRLKEAIIAYKYRLFNENTDAPYNYILLALYAIVLLLAVSSKNLSRLIPIVLLGVGGRMIWIYLFFAGRYPERVTMSLYIMEILLLMGIIIRHITNDGMVQKTTIIQKAAIIGVGVAFILGSVQAVSKLDVEYSKVYNTNSSDDMLYSYMYDHLEDFYFLDVYATVSRTKPVLEASRYSPKNYKMQGASLISHECENYMLLGGWMVAHPLYNDKLDQILSNAGENTVCGALLANNSFHIVVKDGVGADPDELSRVVGAKARVVDSIEAGDVTFYVYSFCE